jgi:hypothetical protein
MTLDEASLEEHERSTSQAETAREVKEIYDWWKFTRPARPDAYDVSGWSDLCEEKRADGGNMFDRGDADYQERSRKSLEIVRKIEQEYEDEDEQMLIRVIKRRRGLWT